MRNKRWRSVLAYRRDPLRHRDRNLRNAYGIGLAEYEALLDQQEGRCAICQIPESESIRRVGRYRKELSGLEVDHCHATGKIRGLLCFKCNRSIGVLGDTAEKLQRAIDYLRKGTP